MTGRSIGDYQISVNGNGFSLALFWVGRTLTGHHGEGSGASDPTRAMALRYTRIVKIAPEELTRRLTEADRRRVALRRVTLELAELGRQLLRERSAREIDGANRSERSHRGPAGSRSSI